MVSEKAVSSDRRNIILLGLLCFVVQFPGLINNGVFWDDWTIFNMSRQGLEIEFRGTGGYYSGTFLLNYILQQAEYPAHVYRLLTFIFCFGSSVIFYRILLSFKEIEKQASFYMAALFLVAPFFSAKTTMICLPYTICLFVFLLGFLLFINSSQKIIWRILSLVLFFISFITNSLLLFYIVVPLYILYCNRGVGLVQLVRKYLRYADFMVLPVIFWFIKVRFFAPTGYYALESYNEISIHRFFYLPSKFMVILNESFLGMISLFYNNVYPYTLLLLLVVLFFAAWKKDWLERRMSFPSNKKYGMVLLIGLFLFFGAALPYLIVGKIPLFAGYQSRHQLLLPIGFSIVTISLIGIFIQEKFSAVVLIGTLGIIMIVNLQIQQQFLVGWFKQESIIANLKLKPIPENYKTIELIDNVKQYNATEASMTFYEWCGIAKYTTGKQDVLIFNVNEFATADTAFNLTDGIKLRKQFNALLPLNVADYYPDGSCHTMIVSATAKELDSWVTVLKLTYFYYFNHDHFDSVIGSYLTLQYRISCSDELKAIL